MSDKKKVDVSQDEIGQVMDETLTPTLSIGEGVNGGGKVMYMGVAIVEKDKDNVEYRLNFGTIFSNGLPEVVVDRCKTDADFKKMFVPVGEVGATMQLLNNRDSDFFVSRNNLRRNRG